MCVMFLRKFDDYYLRYFRRTKFFWCNKKRTEAYELNNTVYFKDEEYVFVANIYECVMTTEYTYYEYMTDVCILQITIESPE